MRQVPQNSQTEYTRASSPNSPRYTLIGNGRLATHLKFYFGSLDLKLETWNRRDDSSDECLKRIESADVILLAIRDDAIDSFLRALPETLQKKRFVHFSGRLVTSWAVGCHPLMTFTESLFSLERYKRIPFILDEDESFQRLFPSLPNPHHTIDRNLKPLYHALCVLSGNFSVLLWEKAFSDFETRLHLPRETLYPYLEQITHNLSCESRKGHSVLTGPLVRGDQETIAKNIEALSGDGYQSVYQKFVEAYRASVKESL